MGERSRRSSINAGRATLSISEQERRKSSIAVLSPRLKTQQLFAINREKLFLFDGQNLSRILPESVCRTRYVRREICVPFRPGGRGPVGHWPWFGQRRLGLGSSSG